MLGKLPSQLLRLSGIIATLHEAFTYVKNKSEEKRELNRKFVNDLNIYFKERSLDHKFNIVDKIDIDRAYNLLTYFNVTKLILAGFKIDNTVDFKFNEIIENILVMNTATSKLNDDKFDHRITTIARYILMKKQQEMNLSDIQQKFRKLPIIAKIEDVINVVNKLEQMHYGKTIVKPNQRGIIYFKICYVFKL